MAIDSLDKAKALLVRQRELAAKANAEANKLQDEIEKEEEKDRQKQREEESQERTDSVVAESKLPSWCLDGIKELAYERGHAHGVIEVDNYVQDYIYIFEKHLR